MQEHKKVLALKKMQADEEHMALVAAKRQEIQQQRKKMTQDSVRARQGLAKMMEDMRKSKKTKDPAELLKLAGLDADQNPPPVKPRTASAPPARPAPKQPVVK